MQPLTYPLFLHLDYHILFLWQPLDYASNITPQPFAPLNYKSQCSLCITTLMGVSLLQYFLYTIYQETVIGDVVQCYNSFLALERHCIQSEVP